MESFKLQMPACPECGARDTTIDIEDYSNLVRIPVAAGTAAMIGLPLNAISFMCRKCGTHFKDKGLE